MTHIPIAELRVLYHMTNPPKPVGVDVLVGGQTVAVIEGNELKRVYELFLSFENATKKA